MSVYEKSYRLLSSDVDADQRLRLSRLFTFLQEASIAHTTALGMGREKTLDFPRYYRMEDREGRTLLTGSALWALMDRESRKMVFPEDHGVRIDGEKGERPLPLPAAPKPAREGIREDFTVPYSYVDLNGHMNNTRYLDLAEDRMPADLRARPIREVRAEYSGEAKLGETVALTYGVQGAAFLLSGDRERKLFRLNLLYED